MDKENDDTQTQWDTKPLQKKNWIWSFSAIRMELEIVRLNEISQAQKDKKETSMKDLNPFVL